MNEQEFIWLDTPPAEEENVMPLLVAYPAEEMEMYEVSKMVNSPKNDSPQNIVPVGGEKPAVKLTAKRVTKKA